MIKLSTEILSFGELQRVAETEDCDIFLIIWFPTVGWVLNDATHFVLGFAVSNSPPVVITYPDGYVSGIMPWTELSVILFFNI